MEGIDIKSTLLNNKTTIFRILFFCLIAIIIFLVVRVKFTIDKIRKHWNVYKCKYPYSIFGGYLAPNGIKDSKGKVHYGMSGSKINYSQCNENLHKAFIGSVMAPVYASYGNDLNKLKSQKKNMSVLMRYTVRIREIIGESFKRVFKFLLVIYYILIYIFQKIKMILFKVQGVIDVILDTFKIYLRFINYVIFTFIPNYMTWQVSMLTLSLSESIVTLMMGVGGSIVSAGLIGNSMLLLFGTGAGPILIPVLLVFSAIAVVAIYTLFLWFLGSAKTFIQQNTQFSGIGNIPPLPLLKNYAYDYKIDSISNQSKEPLAQNQKMTAGSVMNILGIITIALGDEVKNDTSTCLTENTVICLKNKNKYLKDCKLDYSLDNNSKILGMVNYEIKENDIYCYEGVYMTGSHYIYENDKLKRCDSIGKKLGSIFDKVYCPITSNGLLNVQGDTKFSVADYNDGKDYSYWNRLVDKKLGIEKPTEEYEEHNYPPLFCNKLITKIKNIGVVEHLNTSNIKIYEYYGIMLSGTVLVHDEGKWKRIWETEAAIRLNSKSNILYNIITEKHTFQYNCQTFADFEELNL